MGAKKRVPLHQNPRGFVEVDPAATEGAVLGVNLRDSSGRVIQASEVLNPNPGAGSSSNFTVWKLIREVPANLVKIAALIGSGFAVRQSTGEWALRTFQEGTGIDITNPGGDAGDPTISLEDLANSGAGALLAITRDAKGRVSGTRVATITGTASQITVANGTAAAGLPTISLADLANTGVGTALVKITRDAKGRVSGTQAASTTDLAEGTNLYFTNARASAAAPVQSVNARTGAVSVPDFVIKATTPTSGDFGRAIINGDRWFNSSTGISYTYNGGAWLSDGSSAPVSSVFGRTGAVVAQAGDYTAAQVGAIPAPVSAGSSATFLRGDTTWSNSLAGTFTAVGMMNISSGAPAYYQATSTGGIQSVLSSNDGLGLGFFGTLSNHDLAFVTAGGIRMFLHADGAVFRPNVDNATSLGRAANRWSVVYAGTGSINTSDAREKTEVRQFSDQEAAAAIELGKEIGAFKWLASVADKGDAARWHIGMTVQRAIAVMESHGLDPFAYGFICYDEWEGTPEQVSEWPDQLDEDGNVIALGGSARTPAIPAGNLYSFRPDGLHAFILRGLAERQNLIEQRLQALEQGA